jgi:hypothetical protein
VRQRRTGRPAALGDARGGLSGGAGDCCGRRRQQARVRRDGCELSRPANERGGLEEVGCGAGVGLDEPEFAEGGELDGDVETHEDRPRDAVCHRFEHAFAKLRGGADGIGASLQDPLQRTDRCAH